MIEYIWGDLLESDCDVIGHGCNCFHAMGSGIAQQIKYRWPEVYLADKATTLYGDINKLGTYSECEVINKGKSIKILNCYTQYKYGFGLQVNYNAIADVMKLINENTPMSKKIGIPKIGAGLGGGDWNMIEGIIQNIFDNRFIFIYILNEQVDRV